MMACPVRGCKLSNGVVAAITLSITFCAVDVPVDVAAGAAAVTPVEVAAGATSIGPIFPLYKKMPTAVTTITVAPIKPRDIGVL